MTLRPGNVTRASRIMLPTDVVFSALLGAAWTFQATRRTDIPALHALREVWPIQATGLILLLLAVTVFVAMIAGHRSIAAVALGAGVIAYLALAVAIAASLCRLRWGWPPIVYTGSSASLSAPLWPAYIAVAHLASMVSLAFDEVTGNHDRGTHAA